jgi:hypothetical protein
MTKKAQAAAAGIKLRQSTFPVRFHLRDLLGRGSLERVQIGQSEAVIRLGAIAGTQGVVSRGQGMNRR